MKKHVFLLLTLLAAEATFAQNSAPCELQGSNKTTIRSQIKHDTEVPRIQPSVLSFYTALKENGAFFQHPTTLPETFSPVQTDKKATRPQASSSSGTAQNRPAFPDRNLSARIK